MLTRHLRTGAPALRAALTTSAPIACIAAPRWSAACLAPATPAARTMTTSADKDRMERLSMQLQSTLAHVKAQDVMAHLRAQFEALSPDADGLVDTQRVADIPEFNKFVDDVSGLFDRNGSGKINLQEFTLGMNFLYELANRVHRSSDYYNKFMFAMIDEDGNGEVDQDELRSFLSVANSLGVLRRGGIVGSASTDDEVVDAMLTAFTGGDADAVSRDDFEANAHKVFDYSTFEKYTVKDIE